jgi:hypothetical protein
MIRRLIEISSATAIAMFFVSQSLAATVIISTSDSPVSAGRDNQGFWRDAAANANPTNDNYIAGFIVGLGDFRSYFSFDLSGVTGTVVSATLQLRRYDTDPGATLNLFDVNTSASALAQRQVIDNAIYGDLGSGVSYGSFTAGSGNSLDVMSFALNAAARGDINAALGAFFSIGATSTGGVHFSHSNDEPGNSSSNFTQQLVLETEPSLTATPLPAALPLFATGLGVMGLLGWRRKRQDAVLAA